MRLVTFRSPQGPRAGVLDEGAVIDAWNALGEPERSSLRELIAAERLGDLGEALAGGKGPAAEKDAGGSLPLDEVELLPPIPDPEKIVCIGLNYRSHAAEAGIEAPQSPAIFGKFRNALAAPGATVRLPAASQKVDFEAELAFVVGRTASEVSEEEALECVAGYTLLNDLSARDLQFATPQWMSGKVFDGSAPCGPALVTPDEAGPHDAIEISLRLNGEEMQAASTADLIFSVPQLLSHLSGLMTLAPGDIVSTGTPAGVGSVREPRVWLRDGDEIVIDSPTIGTLTTRIAS
jgi:2-keto-4-pentenoate hydratase/2-oxohepta-3-ene-1,7-dioic acid hydratase in catechol pathway